jgi:hypothetical protein
MKWQKKGLIFAPDASNSWSRSHAQVPLVEPRGKDTLRVYYGTRDDQNRTRISYFETRIDDPAAITYIHDAPILPLGDTGYFDDSGVMPSDVVTCGAKTYLYYVGWNTGHTSRYRTSLGLALSEDQGHSFAKISAGPIMDRTMEDPLSVSCQSVLRDGELWKTWYMSYTRWIEVDGLTEPLYEIKYAESSDGIHWDRRDATCISIGEHEGGVACPTVLYERGRYRMWYSVRGKGDYRNDARQSYRIGYAESSDGVAWERMDAEAGIDISAEGWDAEMIAYPYVLRVENRLLMFYNGNGFGKSGIGYAELIHE